MSCLIAWYTRKELAFRTALLYCGSLISGAFSSLIAAGITSSLDGARGISSWRWLFIIEVSSALSHLFEACADPGVGFHHRCDRVWCLLDTPRLPRKHEVDARSAERSCAVSSCAWCGHGRLAIIERRIILSWIQAMRVRLQDLVLGCILCNIVLLLKT